MAWQKVHFKIDKKSGVMNVEGEGFTGNQCDVLTDLENQLGMVTKSEDKAERYQYIQPDYVPNTLAG